MVGSGAHIHDINKWKWSYDSVVAEFAKCKLVSETDVDAPTLQRLRNIAYNRCLQVERMLRAVVTEGEAGRYRQVYPD